MGPSSRIWKQDVGSDAPGTILSQCSDAFRNRFKEADPIIAKGQGNYESLSDGEKEIFFLLKAKCPVIASLLQCEVGKLVFKRVMRGIRCESPTA